MPAHCGGGAAGSRGDAPQGGGPFLRVLVGDELGCTKVFESVGLAEPAGKVVTRWGASDRDRGVECMSILAKTSIGGDCAGVAGIGRTDGTVDLVDLSSGIGYLTIAPAAPAAAAASTPVDRIIAKEMARIRGVHMLSPNASRECPALIAFNGEGSTTMNNLACDGGVWAVSSSALWKAREKDSQTVLCTAIDRSERTIGIGGKLLDVGLWDMESQTRKWHARNPKPNAMGLVTLPWVTQISFLGEDERKVVVGSADHELRLYDTNAQRRPVAVTSHGETPIKAMAAGLDDTSLYVGNGAGDLVCFDTRTWKVKGGYRGHSSSIRSIVRHPTLPVIASCGLGRYLFVHDVHSRKSEFKVFLKQQLTAVCFDDGFTGPPPTDRAAAEILMTPTGNGSEKGFRPHDDRETGEGEEEEERSNGERRPFTIPRKAKLRKGGRRCAKVADNSDDEEDDDDEVGDLEEEFSEGDEAVEAVTTAAARSKGKGKGRENGKKRKRGKKGVAKE